MGVQEQPRLLIVHKIGHRSWMREGIININLELVPSAKIGGSVSVDMQKTVFARDWFTMQLSKRDASVD